MEGDLGLVREFRVGGGQIFQNGELEPRGSILTIRKSKGKPFWYDMKKAKSSDEIGGQSGGVGSRGRGKDRKQIG